MFLVIYRLVFSPAVIRLFSPATLSAHWNEVKVSECIINGEIEQVMQSCDHKGRSITDWPCRSEWNFLKIKRDFFFFFFFFLFQSVNLWPSLWKVDVWKPRKHGREHCHWKPVTSRTRPVCVMDVYYVKSQTFSSLSAFLSIFMCLDQSKTFR